MNCRTSMHDIQNNGGNEQIDSHKSLKTRFRFTCIAASDLIDYVIAGSTSPEIEAEYSEV